VCQPAVDLPSNNEIHLPFCADTCPMHKKDTTMIRSLVILLIGLMLNLKLTVDMGAFNNKKGDGIADPLFYKRV
jgi:hypothetical protein